MKHTLFCLLAIAIVSCSKQHEDPQQRMESTSHLVVWSNQTDVRGGYGLITRNSMIQVFSSNTGTTTTNNFGVNHGDTIAITVKASRGEVTPLGVKRLLAATGVLEFIPGSFQAIPGGSTGSYSFIIDTAYRYTIIFGTAP